jgi:MarR-like DNA-binding transcriptional regulator SgrR of sgrS sRNA
MTQTEAERILEALREEYGEKQYDPTVDVTVRMLAQSLGIGDATARTILAKEEQAGRLVKRYGFVGVRGCAIWRKA